jgi:hypothetical protein
MGDADQFLGVVAEFAVPFDLTRTHPSVAIHFDLRMGTVALFLASALDAFANRGRRRLGRGTRDVAVFDGAAIRCGDRCGRGGPEMRCRQR